MQAVGARYAHDPINKAGKPVYPHVLMAFYAGSIYPILFDLHAP